MVTLKQKISAAEELSTSQQQEMETLQAKFAMTQSDLSTAESSLNQTIRQHKLEQQQSQVRYRF